MNALVSIALLVLALAGCREDRTLVIDDDLSAAPSSPLTSRVDRRSSLEGVPSAADVPLAEDYADEAERVIREDNAEGELARIEAELDEPAGR